MRTSVAVVVVIVDIVAGNTVSECPGNWEQQLIFITAIYALLKIISVR